MKPSITKIVASYIKVLRKKHHHTQLEIAELLCIDESAYSRLESGNTMISQERLYKIACVYKEPIENFFKDIVENHTDNLTQERPRGSEYLTYGEKLIFEKIGQIEEQLSALKMKLDRVN